MPILSPPPLPVERFEDFKHFALTLDPASWVNATGIALSIQHMLGIAIVGPDAEEEALQQWAADFDTERCRENSERAQRAAVQPLPYAFSFAFGVPPQGWGQAAWAVPPVKILELNSWMRWALSQFYDACNQPPDTPSSKISIQKPTSKISVPSEGTLTETHIESTQPAPAGKRVRASSLLDGIVGRMRTAIAEGKITAERLGMMRVDDLPGQFNGSRSHCYRARKRVLGELSRQNSASEPGQPVSSG